METNLKEQLQPGVRVKVTQQIAGRDYTWATEVTGTVIRYEQKQTGSWYAHSRGDRLWLDRLEIKRDNGELITLNLDEYTVVQVEPPPAQANHGKSNGSAK